jgi:uncharacterized protein (DUF58 family)
MKSPLLAARDYELIRVLELSVRRKFAGLAAGERRSPAPGGGIEFADYREYLPGDDIRGIDWPVFLRLRKLVVRICAEEKELSLVVLLDASGSMDSGKPSKLLFAKRLAAVLAGIAIKGGDRAGICVLGPTLAEPLRPERRKTSLELSLRVLESIPPSGPVDPAACMGGFQARYGRKCLAVLISDLLVPRWAELLDGLAASGCESHVLHVLAPDEFEPEERGEVTLVDSEDGAEVPLHADVRTLRRYAEEMAAFLSEAASRCGSLGLGYSVLGSDLGLERAFRGKLREEGIVC